MNTDRLTFAQYVAICNIINGLRKLNVEPRNSYDLSSFDESSYESTTITFNHAIRLFSSLQSFMNNVYNSRY